MHFYRLITLFGSTKFIVVCRLDQSVIFVVFLYSVILMYENSGSVEITDYKLDFRDPPHLLEQFRPWR